jgi:hypothetical protein
MMYRAMIAVFSETNTKHINALCVQNVEFFNVNLLKPTGYVMHQQVQHSIIVLSAHTVFMCFVFIWEQTATCAIYSINWLVFIAEMKSVYSAVRTGSLNKAVCVSSLKPTGYVMHQQFNIQQLYALPTRYLCVLYLSESKQRLVPLTA